MSGLGAPAFTATPMPERAISTRERDTSLPSLIRPSMPAPVLISRSAVSPSATRLLSAPEVASTRVTLCPVAFSNFGTRSSSTVVMAAELKSLISAAPAVPAHAAASSPSPKRIIGLIIRFLPLLVGAIRPLFRNGFNRTEEGLRAPHKCGNPGARIFHRASRASHGRHQLRHPDHLFPPWPLRHRHPLRATRLQDRVHRPRLPVRHLPQLGLLFHEGAAAVGEELALH